MHVPVLMWNWKTKTTEMTSPVILSLFLSLSTLFDDTIKNQFTATIYLFEFLFDLIWFDMILFYFISYTKYYYKLSRLNDYYYHCIVTFIQSIISENAYHMKQMYETLQKCYTILTVPLLAITQIIKHVNKCEWYYIYNMYQSWWNACV